ncbi:MAG: MBL fold metallo-hydrolase [Anaerolineaceae bacterium]|nr:MBL fold metallo-hydrolase [Anaerolineaceae bacterium]
MEIVPGLHQLQIPPPNNSLDFNNAYLLKTDSGSILIDTGWDTQGSFNALQDQIRAAGVDWPDLSYILITHAHPDHIGLIDRLRPLTRAKLVMHAAEVSSLQTRLLDTGSFKRETDEWMRINGVDAEMRRSFETAWMQMLAVARMVTPDIEVSGGEFLPLGGGQFEIIFTPGHSPGHICLYDPRRRLLFSGDHVLPNIIPSVGMDSANDGIPLLGYVKALHQVSALPVDLVLPGHGQVFTQLSARAAEIEEHHAERIRESAAVISSRSLTAYQVTTHISWPTLGPDWQMLPDFVKRLTVAETISHLEYAVTQGVFDKTQRRGLTFYSNKIG